MPKIGEVRVPCDKDFDELKKQIDDDEGWTLAYDKKKVQIFHRKSDTCSFLMFKVKAEFDDVSANVLYDVLCDGEYRPEWDNNMAEGYDYCLITPYSDIGYFQLKSPKPFKNRDFVTQRCWLDYGDNKDKIIYSHSVNHAKLPPRKNVVRGITYMTGQIARPTSATSCKFLYLTHSDPNGNLPSWLINTGTKSLLPKYIKKMNKACVKYEKWKAKHNPDNKPWYNPELIKIPKIDWNDINELNMDEFREKIDESQISQNDIDKNDLDDDKDD